MEYYNNNQPLQTQVSQTEGGELNDSAVFSAADLGDYDKGGYILLPEGDYDFTIVGLKESRHQDVGGKVGNCKQINPIFRVTNPEDNQSVDIENFNLYMWNSRGCLGMIAQYYDSIGLHKKGEPIHFDWVKDHHIGRTGKLAIKHEKYTRKDGTEGTSFKISKLYVKEDTAATSAGSSGSWGNWK